MRLKRPQFHIGGKVCFRQACSPPSLRNCAQGYRHWVVTPASILIQTNENSAQKGDFAAAQESLLDLEFQVYRMGRSLAEFTRQKA